MKFSAPIDVAEVTGPYAWGVIHHAAESFPCPPCAEEGASLMRFAHDLVNLKLGKPVQYVKDARRWLGSVHELEDMLVKETLNPGTSDIGLDLDLAGIIAQALAQEMIPDPWGSRCRNVDGRWVHAAGCPHIPSTDNPKVKGGPSPSTAQTFAVGNNGLTRYDFEYRVVELEDLVTSHDPFTFVPQPNYPQELQPRLRDRAATRVQVQKIAQDLDADLLLTDFHTLDRGAPIVGPDLVVESGNGRVMALSVAQAEHPVVYQLYMEALVDRLSDFGLSPSALKGIDRPVLVRVRLTSVDRAAFTQEANTAPGISQSAIEQARSDAARITVDMIQELIIGETQGIDDAVRSSLNSSFIVRFLAKLPTQEQARLVDSAGVLNQDGVRRTVLAIFVAAFPGDAGLRLAEMAFESIDLEVRNVVNGISRALGDLAKAELLVREGRRPASLSITGDLVAAISVYAKVRRTPGMTVQKYIDQTQLFIRETTAFQEEVLRTFDQNARSAKRIGMILRGYAQGVIALPPPEQASFMPVEVSKEDVWTKAIRHSTEVVIAAQNDPKLVVDWCNMTVDEVELAWSWRGLRETILTGLSFNIPVWVCTTGLISGHVQLTFDALRLNNYEKGKLEAAALHNLGVRAQQVFEKGHRRLYFLVTLPMDGGELDWKPTPVIRPEPVSVPQPALFQKREFWGLKASLGQPDLSDSSMLLDVSGAGEFISERWAEPSQFHPDSFRTVEQGDHRLILACPKGQWKGNHCTADQVPQSRLHPRGEQADLMREAQAAGIPVLTDHEDTTQDAQDMAQVQEMVDRILAEGGLV